MKEKSKKKPARFSHIVLFIALLVGLISLIFGYFIQPEEDSLYVIESYSVVPSSIQIDYDNGTEDFSSSQIDRIGSIAIIVYSDGTVSLSGWPITDAHILSYYSTTDCRSGDCIRFEENLGYIGSQSAESNDYMFTIDQAESTMTIRFEESYSNWSGEGENFTRYSEHRDGRITVEIE